MWADILLSNTNTFRHEQREISRPVFLNEILHWKYYTHSLKWTDLNHEKSSQALGAKSVSHEICIRRIWMHLCVFWHRWRAERGRDLRQNLQLWDGCNFNLDCKISRFFCEISHFWASDGRVLNWCLNKMQNVIFIFSVRTNVTLTFSPSSHWTHKHTRQKTWNVTWSLQQHRPEHTNSLMWLNYHTKHMTIYFIINYIITFYHFIEWLYLL